jgi:DNA-binding GntR family transcriptional regulator
MKQTSLRVAAYKHIRNAMASGKFKAGSRISTQFLADDIGISRTPVAEALLLLEHEGYLDRFPRSASVVRQPTQQEIAELYELRLALECYAVEQACVKARPEDLSHLKSYLHKMKDCLIWSKEHKQTLRGEMLNHYFASDAAFHMLLVNIGGNSKIRKVIEDAHVYTKIFCFPREREEFQDYDHILPVYKYHVTIYRAVRSRRADVAGRLMKSHIKVSRDSTLEFMGRNIHTDRDAVSLDFVFAS